MALSQQQIELIQQHVGKSVSNSSLRNDLVDHLCCEVEEKLETQDDFIQCFNEALEEIAPAGLGEIQKQTDSMLEPNKTIMKKATYFVGLAASICFSMGLMLKLLHMPGGEQLINYGFLTFAFIFLPAMLVMRVSRQNHLSLVDKLKIGFGVISAIGLALSIITKIRMELDLSTILFMCTTTLFSFGFLPLHFYQLYRKEIA